MAAEVSVLVGTTKGVFLLESDSSRAEWEVRGPFCDGWPINHVIGDPESGTLWAAGGGEWHGAGVWRSEDGGESWSLSKLAGGKFDEWLKNDPEMAAQFGMPAPEDAPYTGQVDALWSLALVDGAVYTGAKPAALYRSDDRGTSFEKVQGLSDHPSADSWEPGGAGLTLHSIVSDPARPERMWLGISAAGMFATEDGGKTWDRRNRRSNTSPAADDGHGHDPQEVGHCIHNFVRAGAAEGGDMLYQQNHHGVFRSPDGGRSWHEITEGLPSNFGFPIAVHPRDPQRIWTLPLMEMAGRYPPDGKAAVWSSGDGGDSWEAQTTGLPEKNCYFTVLRQAMATDKGAPAGVYFGTNSGSVFASADEGATWTEAARHLPTVLCVETLERG